MAENYRPQVGDIGLTQIHGRVGRLIRVGQFLNGDGFYNYQHAFIVTDVTPGQWTSIVEAEPGGAQFNSMERYRGYQLSFLRCPDEYRDAVGYAATQIIGIGYSYADYLALALHRIGIKTPKLQKYIASSGHMICSQAADFVASTGGWQLFDDGRWFGDVTPGDLYGLFRKQSGNSTAYYE
jgi:hypothetical protein